MKFWNSRAGPASSKITIPDLAGKLDADGHRVGQGWLHRRTFHSSGTTGDGSREQSPQLHRNLPADWRTRCATGLRHCRRRKNQPGRVHVLADPDHLAEFKAGDVLGDFNDRSRVGTNHEEERRRLLPTAAVAPVTAQSSAANWDFPALSAPATRPSFCKAGTDVTVSCAEGAHGNIYEGLIEFAVDRRVVGDEAATPHPGDDERRRSGPRVCRCFAAKRRRWPRASRVHHQQPHRHSSDGPGALSASWRILMS